MSDVHQVPLMVKENNQNPDSSMIKMSDEDADQLLVKELLELPQDSMLNQDFSFRDELQNQNCKS